MLRSRIFPVVLLLLAILFVMPAHASLSETGLTKVIANAPVFIGEQNVDISSGMNGHSVIAWWPPGADISGNPTKTITISGDPHAFYIDPALFTGYTGTWYTHDVKPDVPVFVVYQPQINLSVWDTDTNTDVTGQSVPFSANITYRIDTNLYMALNYTYRPYYNPSNGFFAVTLTSPSGANIPSLFSGNVGNPTTQIIPFDSDPLITSSPYTWQNGPAWDHNAKGTDGSAVYPPGTYTFVITANLNGMTGSYPGSTALGNVTSGNKTITLLPVAAFTTTTTVPPIQNATNQTSTVTAAVTLPVQQTTVPPTAQPTSAVIPAKTTYTPLPDSLAIAAFGIAACVIAASRKY